ncbi:poly(R)-hydroxyalkanoic acid synthase subunit PhaE [Serpentinicella sp. ANB-PHB4]|uniref:poly(R)-hydroxyalkanoic acid synthase subunit PhaE n=1 Tax=Serpentinicella sp. ANB-PHB4 TaxID=3074076 RepID=UPI002859E495|nr:poly(R)-hydroxyalkanoic acid synthase subunit PhaE [Serpentinicella sp. ANB-PHB4]MDR5658087.1 poly(R)-hydroxyalkanoic acid synthase subunit PhaE [Serpentinicella sp. ANB-PHB4]
MNMLEFQENFTKQYFDMQKKAMNAVGDGFSPNFMEQIPNFFTGNKEMAENMKLTVEMYNRLYESINNFCRNTGNKLPGYSTCVEFFNDMLETVDGQKTLKNYYEETLNKLEDNIKTETDILSLNLKSFEIFSHFIDNFSPYLPQPVQNFFHENLLLQEMFINTARGVYQPWYDSMAGMQKSLSKWMAGDVNGLRDYMRLCNDNYQKTFKKLTTIPKFNSSDNNIMAIQMESANILIELYNYFNDTREKTVNDTYEIMDSIMKKYNEFFRKGINADAINKFNNYFISKSEDLYKKVTSSYDSTDLMRQMTNTSKDFASKFQNTIDTGLENQPFATKQDIDHLNEKLDRLTEAMEKLNSK